MVLCLPPPVRFPTTHLPLAEDFRFVGEEVLLKDRIELSHKRAKAIAMSYHPTIDDVLNCSQKFWNMHIDPINGFDGAAVTLWTLQLNLAGGTLAPFVKSRPELAMLWRNIINFEVTAHYMLTELGHGLDAPNIETTAELLPGQGFDLHTPNDNAAKFMPASIPAGGIPRIAIVMARLRINGRDLGIRPFIVPLNNGHRMCHGVTARPLPTRCGSKALGHAITHFHHVKLPLTALLGDLKPPMNPRVQFLSDIWRIGIGSICLTSVVIPGLKLAAYITAEYSKRRKVTTPLGQVLPIISFRTQHAPILHALVQAVMLEALYQELRTYFTDRDSSSLEHRNGLSTIFKVIAIKHWRQSSITLADRCGAQGLFEHNQIIPMQMEIRGVTIAEGDILVLSIRLASELLLGRYQMSPSRHPWSLLAMHEAGTFARLKRILSEFEGKHRSEEFNRRLLPHSLALAEAIGCRMTYEAALDAGVDSTVLRVYEAGVILQDVAWYSENGLMTQQHAFEVEEEALSALLPSLDTLLEHSGVKPYTFAAITSEASWDTFVATLPVYQGDTYVDPLNPVGSKVGRARL